MMLLGTPPKAIALVVLVALAVACQGSESPVGGRLLTYVHPLSGYSLQYPRGWQVEEINANETAFGQGRNKHGPQVQVGAFPGSPVLPILGRNRFAAAIEASTEQLFLLDEKCRDYRTVTNEPATNSRWDWVLIYLVICEDKPLAGVMYNRETSSVSYTIFLLQYSGVDFPEGQTVINSIAFRDE